MADLFGGVDAPQYVGPAVQVPVSKSGAGLFGMFPGTPDYAAAPSPPVVAPRPPIVAPGPAASPSSNSPSIEVTVRVPGLLNLQGSVMAPHWLLDCAPLFLPLVLHYLRQKIAEGTETASCSVVTSEEATAPATTECDRPPRESAYARPETEARVWDRE